MSEIYDWEKTIEEVFGEGPYQIVGYVDKQFGDDIPVFKISRIIPAGREAFWVGGEHDIAFIPNDGEAMTDLLNSHYEEEE